MPLFLTRCCWNFAIGEVQKDVNLIDLVKKLSNEHLLAKFGVDTAENQPLKVLLIIQPWDLIFTVRRPASRCKAGRAAVLPGLKQPVQRVVQHAVSPLLTKRKKKRVVTKHTLVWCIFETILSIFNTFFKERTLWWTEVMQAGWSGSACTPDFLGRVPHGTGGLRGRDRQAWGRQRGFVLLEYEARAAQSALDTLQENRWPSKWFFTNSSEADRSMK